METTPLWFLRTLLVCHQLPLGGHSSDPLALSGLVEWKLLLDTGGYRFCSRSPTFFWFFVVFQNFFCLFKTMASCVPQRRAEESLPHRGPILYLAIWSLTCSPASISEQLIRIHHRKRRRWNVAAQNGWKQTPRRACLQLANDFIDNDADQWEEKKEIFNKGAFQM